MNRGAQFLSVLAIVWLSQFDPAAAANVAVLMPGSGGGTPNDFLVRNEGRFRAAGIRTIMTTSPSSAAQLIEAETSQGRKIVIVGMSKGAVDVASALASGARPSGAVFVSGIHSMVMATLGSPGRLPATLVVHHSQDACRRTPPSDASRFVAWAGGKARIQWINTTGQPSNNPCNAQGAHGFFKQDGPAISAIISFVKSH
jgi:predicted esterase